MNNNYIFASIKPASYRNK